MAKPVVLRRGSFADLINSVFYLKMVKKMMNQLLPRNVNWTLGNRQRRRRSYEQGVLDLAIMRTSVN